MAMKSITLITFLVVVLAVTQAEAQLSIPRISIINITGNVSCSVNGTVGVNVTTPVPPFPNALVQLSCGGLLPIRGIAITDQMGRFNIVQSGLLNTLTNILANCRVVVATPLSQCNATLPAIGSSLSSTLQVVNSTVVGLLNITNLIPTGFNFTARV